MDLSYVETIDDVTDAVTATVTADHVEGLMLFAAADDRPAELFEDVLGSLDVPVFGGIFPELIYRGEKVTTGAVVCGLTTEPQVTTVPGLSDPEAEYGAHLDPDLPVEGYETAFVFVDAYATEIERFIDSLFRTYSVEFNYIGGGAGSLDMEQQPCLFTGDGVVEDSAVVAAVSSPLELGVKHGWQEIAGPFRVTDADGPTLNSLDGTPAFSVYSDVVDDHAGRAVTRDNFFEIAKGYPFGVARIEGEQIVRDPFEVTDEGGLNCFGDVPEGEFVHILEGDPDSLVNAAQQATTAAQGDETTADTLFFFDCISRVLYLEEAFDRELAHATVAGTEMVGALTIGEIANDGAGHLDYYNKTAVVGTGREI